MKRKISLPLALVAMLAAGFTMGRWSSQLPSKSEAVLVQSNVVQSDAGSPEDVAVALAPLEGGGGQAARGFSTQELSVDDTQVFAFFMGITR